MNAQTWVTIVQALAVLSGAGVTALVGYRASVKASGRTAAIESRRVDNEDFKTIREALREEVSELRADLREEQAENEKLTVQRRTDHLALREMERKVAALEQWARDYQQSLTDVIRVHSAFDQQLIDLLAAKGETDLPFPPPLMVPPPPLPRTGASQW